MPLIQIVIVLIVIGVLLWLVNLIPMQGTIKSILNAVVVICVVLWLLNVFGVLTYLPHIRVGSFSASAISLLQVPHQLFQQPQLPFEDFDFRGVEIEPIRPVDFWK
jgi:hypothetical protein